MRTFDVNDIVNYGGDNVRILERKCIGNGDAEFYIYKIDVKRNGEYQYVNDFELESGKILCPDCEMLTIPIETGECKICGYKDEDIIGKTVCDKCYGRQRFYRKRFWKAISTICPKCDGKGYISSNPN